MRDTAAGRGEGDADGVGLSWVGVSEGVGVEPGVIVGVDAGEGVGVGAGVIVGVDAGEGVGVGVGLIVGVDVGEGVGVEAGVIVGVDAGKGVGVGLTDGDGVCVDVDIGVVSEPPPQDAIKAIRVTNIMAIPNMLTVRDLVLNRLSSWFMVLSLRK